MRSKFIEAIQNYQRVEQDYRVKSRQRVERQLKIGESLYPLLVIVSGGFTVNPDATQEEVNAAVEGGGQQVFAQAVREDHYTKVMLINGIQLTTSSRYGESRMAYREVQERQVEIKKMEQTLGELAQLFNDVGKAFVWPESD